MSELAWPEPDIGTSGTSRTWRKKAVVLLYAPRSRDAEPFEWSLEYSGSEEQSSGEEKETPAVAEARNTMRSLSVDELGASGLTQGVQDRVLEFLDATTTEASTFPSIVPDDDGVAVLHWVAGRGLFRLMLKSLVQHTFGPRSRATRRSC